MGHKLSTVVVVDENHAKYYCECGAVGTATYGSWITHTREQLRKRAVFNHSLHRVRALIKEGN